MTARAAVRYSQTWTCSAPDALFGDDWQTATDSTALAIVESQHGLPCDGGGRPGDWCYRCHWGDVRDQNEEDVEL